VCVLGVYKYLKIPKISVCVLGVLSQIRANSRAEQPGSGGRRAGGGIFVWFQTKQNCLKPNKTKLFETKQNKTESKQRGNCPVVCKRFVYMPSASRSRMYARSRSRPRVRSSRIPAHALFSSSIAAMTCARSSWISRSIATRST
jgi:hypothetical protein